MKVLGITGGIASGKTLVSQQFKSRGFTVLDADAMVHELYESEAVIDQIQARFPTVIENHILDRKALGNLVFNDENAKKDLENILHPKVYDKIKTELLNHPNESWVIVDIPLLYETGGVSLCDLVMVVYVNEDLQRKRLMLRNQLTLEEANQRIASQMPLKDKVNQADIVIDNSGTIQKTLDRINEIIDKVLL